MKKNRIISMFLSLSLLAAAGNVSATKERTRPSRGCQPTPKTNP